LAIEEILLWLAWDKIGNPLYLKTLGYLSVSSNLGEEVASGIYFCILRSGERTEGKKMLLMK
jgi:hypothetical protein